MSRRTRNPQSLAKPPDNETRRAILLAAIAVFGERGLKGATVREITRRAGALPSLVNYYFGGKAKLWAECAAFIHAELYATIARRLRETASLDPGARMKALIGDYVMAAAADADVLRFMRRHAAETPLRNKAKAKAPHGAAIAELMVRAITAAQKAGLMDAGIDPLLFERIIAGAAVHLYDDAVIYEQLAKRKARDPAVIEAHLAALLRLFMRA